MTLLTIGLIAGATLMAAAGGVLFVLAVKKGQFDDIEDTKFQILREDEADERSQIEDSEL